MPPGSAVFDSFASGKGDAAISIRVSSKEATRMDFRPNSHQQYVQFALSEGFGMWVAVKRPLKNGGMAPSGCEK